MSEKKLGTLKEFNYYLGEERSFPILPVSLNQIKQEHIPRIHIMLDDLYVKIQDAIEQRQYEMPDGYKIFPLVFETAIYNELSFYFGQVYIDFYLDNAAVSKLFYDETVFQKMFTIIEMVQSKYNVLELISDVWAKNTEEHDALSYEAFEETINYVLLSLGKQGENKSFYGEADKIELKSEKLLVFASEWRGYVAWE